MEENNDLDSSEEDYEPIDEEFVTVYLRKIKPHLFREGIINLQSEIFEHITLSVSSP